MEASVDTQPAAPPPMTRAGENTAASRQLVSFTIDDELYGVDVMAVREIRGWSPTTRLPGEPHYCRGVLNIRGEALPVHDLRARFGGAQTVAGETHVVVIVTLGASSAGLLVDAVSDILDIDSSEICDVPDGAREFEDGAIVGLVPREKKMLSIVDVGKLF